MPEANQDSFYLIPVEQSSNRVQREWRPRWDLAVSVDTREIASRRSGRHDRFFSDRTRPQWKNRVCEHHWILSPRRWRESSRSKRTEFMISTGRKIHLAWFLFRNAKKRARWDCSFSTSVYDPLMSLVAYPSLFFAANWQCSHNRVGSTTDDGWLRGEGGWEWSHHRFDHWLRLESIDWAHDAYWCLVSINARICFAEKKCIKRRAWR